MDELRTVRQLLAAPPPEPEVVEAARLRLERAALGRTPLRTRAAAAAMAGVIVASVALSGALLRPGGTGGANSTGVFAKVPRYFVAIPTIPGRAVVAATATGAVRGTVAPPRPYTMFVWVTAAGDARTFVLAAGVPPAVGTSVLTPRPVKF
jgi:hypothetical protein